MRNYYPLGERVIVEVLPFEEKKSDGGIIIETDQHSGFKAKKLRGKVLRTGSLAKATKADDIVVFEDNAGVPLDYNIPDIVWMEESQIVAIEKEE